MGKGKIIITNEQPSQHEQDKQQNASMASINKQKKIKNKKKKQKKKKNRISAIQLIADQQQKQQQQSQQQQQQQQQNNKYKNDHNNLKTNIKTNLTQKSRLKNLTICFPDSILQIPQTSTLRSYFISQVARISSIFKVDQILILKDHGYNAKSQNFNPSQYIARNLQYLQTPQYLRKHLFKMHADLKNVGLMNPIQCNHHLKTNDICQFRQGVALDRPTKQGYGSWVDIGLKQQARMNCMVLPNTRVTLRLKDYQNNDISFYQAQAISKKIPRQQQNLYWGYDVKIINNFKQMFKSAQYDIKIICNHHQIIKSIQNINDFQNLDLEDKSILIFFSGTDDLSTLIERDQKAILKIDQILKRFDYSLAFQNFGVQKLRMEEQLFMALCKLSKFVI